MKRISAVATPVIFAGIVFALTQPDAEGCGMVPPLGHTIHIAEESAVIVWDSKNKTEHFIRRAAFDTKSPDFGFLVPTPTQPILAEAKDVLFRNADQWIRPKTVEQTRYKFNALSSSFCCLSFMGSAAPPSSDMAGGVRVLAEQKVGGFDATVLEADDADELAKWIKDHGYSADPELYAWLTPYVAAKWKITTFKIMQDPETGQLATSRPVRMSFATERPFFPYREPEVKTDKQNQRPRLLRVFLVSDARVEGKFGNSTPWHARIPWSDELSEEQRVDVAKDTGIAAADLPAKLWMTAFEDPASPRPGKEEIYFEPSAERTPIRPPPLIRYNEVWIPLDVVFLATAFLFLIGWAIKRVGWKIMMPTGRPTRREPPEGPPLTPWSAS